MSDLIESFKYVLIYKKREKLSIEGYSQEEIDEIINREEKAFEEMYDIPFPELLKELRNYGQKR